MSSDEREEGKGPTTYDQIIRGGCLAMVVVAGLIWIGSTFAPSGDKDGSQVGSEPSQLLAETCLAANARQRDAGLILHGGASPGVDQTKWAGLSATQKAEIFQTAGCIANGFRPGTVRVEVTGEGGFPVIETRDVEVR